MKELYGSNKIFKKIKNLFSGEIWNFMLTLLEIFVFDSLRSAYSSFNSVELIFDDQSTVRSAGFLFTKLAPDGLRSLVLNLSRNILFCSIDIFLCRCFSLAALDKASLTANRFLIFCVAILHRRWVSERHSLRLIQSEEEGREEKCFPNLFVLFLMFFPSISVATLYLW